MALKAPNPSLAAETLSVTIRSLVDDTSGGPSWSASNFFLELDSGWNLLEIDGSGLNFLMLQTGAPTTTYPAIVTMQVRTQDSLRAIGGTILSVTLWDVLIFSSTDPGVIPQATSMNVVGQNRTLIAETESTERETGCWYVLGKTYD